MSDHSSGRKVLAQPERHVRRVLLAAGGESLRLAVSRLHIGSEWTRSSVSDEEEALWFLRRFMAEVGGRLPFLVVDSALPPRGGVSLCRFVRSQEKLHFLPVLMVSENPDPNLCITSLEAGADDFLRLPASHREFLSRIGAILRRAESKTIRHKMFSFDKAEFDGLVVNVARHEVLLNGRYIPLSYKEFAILGVLVGHSDRALPYEEILSLVWGEEAEAGRETLKVHVHSLRKKLGEGPVIESIRGYGYRIRKYHS